MIVAYDMRGLVAFGDTDLEVIGKAISQWNGKQPLRVSIATATPELEADIRSLGLLAQGAETKDGRLGKVSESPYAKVQEQEKVQGLEPAGRTETNRITAYSRAWTGAQKEKDNG